MPPPKLPIRNTKLFLTARFPLLDFTSMVAAIRTVEATTAAPPSPTMNLSPGHSKRAAVPRNAAQKSGTAHSRNLWSLRKNGSAITNIAIGITKYCIPPQDDSPIESTMPPPISLAAAIPLFPVRSPLRNRYTASSP